MLIRNSLSSCPYYLPRGFGGIEDFKKALALSVFCRLASTDLIFNPTRAQET